MTELPRIYIESCPLIDMAKHKANKSPDEEGERNVWFTTRLIQAAKDSEIVVFTSSLSIAECTHIPGVNDPAPSEDIKRFYEELLASGTSGIRLVQPTFTIMEKARDLRWVSGIYLNGAADAIHVASALVMNCREFLTTDKKILNKQDKLLNLNLRVCMPEKTTLLPPQYQQGDLF